jgi:hypothetical protein
MGRIEMRTYNLWLTLGGVAATLGVALGGCNAIDDDCASYRTCSGAGASGIDGESGAPPDSGGGHAGQSGTNAGGAGGASSTDSSGGADDAEVAGAAGSTQRECDTTQIPRDESCLVSEDFAVFVSPDGDDDSLGTREAPLASLTKAAEVAAGDKVVLVCSGTYDERVTITSGARVFGGFDCADWSDDPEAPLFVATDPGAALTVDSVDAEVLIDRVSFEVGDAIEPGETALAAIVNASPRVTLSGVSLKAGSGRAGANGKLDPFSFPSAATLKGNPEGPAAEGGAEKVCSCQKGLTSTGGVGGTPSSSGQNGAKGLPSLGGGAGGDPSAGDCGGGSSGKKGADATPEKPAAGAKRWGTISSAGWEAAAGLDGQPGQPGQGGGGGASLSSSGHGGGGGCGGCGGNGGAAGEGGGGSIALLALGSTVTLEGCSLSTADAGKGGSGAAGQAGQQQAGGGGAPIDTVSSCGGGSGGFGAAGAAGGGGAGGISVGIVWQGDTPPNMSGDTIVSVGKPGSKGPGGAPGDNDGIAGVAQDVLEID